MATFEVIHTDSNVGRAIGAGANQLNLVGRGGHAARAYSVRR